MKFLKIISILTVNIILIFTLLFFTDFCIYKYYSLNYYKNHPMLFPINKYNHLWWFPEYFYDLDKYFTGKNNIYSGRLPDGLEYNEKIPIVIFGCSYAYGQYLNSNQTFSHKLSEQLQRPVYNRSVPGGGFQQMYMQSVSDKLYKTIPFTDTIIYVMISDHYRRTKLQYFDMLDYHVIPVFKIKDGNLVMLDYKNNLKNFFRSLYIVKLINHFYAEKCDKNLNNKDLITDEILLYFIKSRNEFQKRYGSELKFYVLFYEDWNIPYADELRKKLTEKGFIVASTIDMTKENLQLSEYRMPDNYHPTEAAWDLLTPLIIEQFNLNDDIPITEEINENENSLIKN